MTEPLDDIEFLSRSINRVTVLEELSSYPQTRARLEASTDVSKVTIGRILDDFLDRGWIVKTGDTYQTTPIGEVIATDFSQLRTTVETAQKLRSIAPYLFEIRSTFVASTMLQSLSLIQPIRWHPSSGRSIFFVGRNVLGF